MTSQRKIRPQPKKKPSDMEQSAEPQRSADNKFHSELFKRDKVKGYHHDK